MQFSTKEPDISVLISTYNNRRFVAKKLAEIERQTFFPRAEFIFIETASPEKERTLLVPFCSKHPNCRLIALDERKNLYEAWNIGWGTARAGIVCYTNMDDCMHPCLLEQVVDSFRRRRWDACSVLIAKQSADDPQLDDWAVERLRWLPLGLRPGPFTAWRNDLKSHIGFFDDRFVVAGDKDLWARMCARGLRLGLVPKVLYLYTKDPEHQLSKSSDACACDRSLIAGSPYPFRWSTSLRWQVVLLRTLLRHFPKAVTIRIPIA